MPPVDLTRRSHDPEIMDDLACSGDVVEQTLRELDVINRLLGGNAVTLSGVKEMIRNRKSSDHAITVVDLGCGSGYLLRQLADYGRRNKVPMQLTGIDANPFITDFARNQCRAYSEIRIETQNVFAADFAHQHFDIVVGTLFFHHFDNDTLSSLLPQLVRQSRIGVLINDIHRHPLAYHSIRLLTRWFSSSPMVRFDAPLSVRRAFAREDWNRIFSNGGLTAHSIQWKWAFRWKIMLPGAG